ncbi:nucleotide sugar dehydrogenase, partial [Cohnella sp.]|uniref:nucleotide sugar dehydrogenase n=1 Tax=Cohnella sp. TaxID=1883426 RepID=UPI003568D5BA
ALQDVFFPDRIVLGSRHDKASEVMRRLYHKLVHRVNYDELFRYFLFDRQVHPKTPAYYETDIKSAEMIKYASNAFLAVKISFINEIARLCETLGANVMSVASGMGLDSRIGDKFLQVSSGWSGSCFPKDTAELLATGKKYGCELSVVEAAIQSNGLMHKHVIDKVKQKLKSLNGKTIGILGLTFKPNTDDARHTQASVIIGELLDVGARVKVHDPQGMGMFKALNELMEIGYCDNAHRVADNADALILLTHWDEYARLGWEEIHASMRKPFVLDTRNFLNAAELNRLGFEYEGIGIGMPDESKTADRLAITY